MDFYILPASKYHLAKTALREIRCSTLSLSTATELAGKRLIAQAEPADDSMLTPGTQYATLELSHFANAWRGSKLHLNHGEAYIIPWDCQEDKSLTNINAWGITSFLKLRRGMLLMETC